MAYDPYRGESARERAQRRYERQLWLAELAAQELEKLSNLPEEPTTIDPDGALVIWFEKSFTKNGKKYTYAAVKAGDDLWYTTGPRSPKGYTWQELAEWMYDGNGEVNELWKASEWTLLRESDGAS